MADAGEVPWSVAGLLFGVEHALDDEGRPVAERRAPSNVKTGVPMVLKPCPYPDERRGMDMNVSALAQITRHLPDVLADISWFVRAAHAGPPSWTAMLAAVVDQLMGPGVYLRRGGAPPVPAPLAVGHKVAAGYFGVVRKLLRRSMDGTPVPVGVDTFTAFVREVRALVGTSEACAGPPNLVRQCADVFLHGQAESPRMLPWRPGDNRLQVARELSRQLVVSTAWEMFEQWWEYQLFHGMAEGMLARPRNKFMEDRVQRREAEIRGSQGGERQFGDVLLACAAVLPDAEHEELQRDLVSLDAHHPDVVVIVTLLDAGDSALLTDSAKREQVAVHVARFLACQRRFLRTQLAHERAARTALGVTTGEVKLSALAWPHSQVLGWMEAVLGHSLVQPHATGQQMYFRNHHRVVEWRAV